MKIKKDDLRYTAQLCRIELSDEEIDVFSKQLNSILEYMEKLNTLNTESTQPMSHALSAVNITRPDKVKESLPSDDVTRNAPAEEQGFFKVPKIIE